MAVIPKTVRVEIDAATDQWVELHNIGAMSQRKYEDFVARLRSLDQQDRAAAEAFVRERVAAWRVVDADTGATLTEPATDDLGGIPIGVIGLITEQVREMITAAVPFVPPRPSRST